MRTFTALTARNLKIFFRDKGVFFPALLAPLILLFLFVAFLGNVYRDSIRGVLEGFPFEDGLVESVASGWLVSSLVAVCAGTIAFTAECIMVQDRAGGQFADFSLTPVPRSLLALSYFTATYLVTAIVCFVALGAGFIYMGAAGWHLTAADLFLAFADTLLLCLFGTALSSVVCTFLRSQGGVTAVQATVSAAYGFLCGAYMPIGSLVPWLRNAIMLLPGTYGTGLLHRHLMGGAIDALAQNEALAQGLREGFDCDLFFFGSAVPEWVCYLVLALAAFLSVGAYVALVALRRGKHI